MDSNFEAALEQGGRAPQLYPMGAYQYDRMVEQGYDMSGWTRVEPLEEPEPDRIVRYLNRDARRQAERDAKRRRRR